MSPCKSSNVVVNALNLPSERNALVGYDSALDDAIELVTEDEEVDADVDEDDWDYNEDED